MSSNPCDSINCPSGNCVGCAGGQLNCADPRCFPNCPGCKTNTTSSNWIIITVILILLGILLVMAFIVGFDWFKQSRIASQPKNITVNKHVHNIKQPAVIISTPAPVITHVHTPPVSLPNKIVKAPKYTETVEYTPLVSRKIESKTYTPEIRKSITRSVTYDGANLSMDDIPRIEKDREVPCDRR